MTSPQTQVDPTEATHLLREWIGRHAEEEGLAWLDEKRERIAAGAPDWIFFTSFSAVPRYTGKADLGLSEEDLRRAEALRTGWDPRSWSVDQAGRTLFVLALPHENADAHVAKLEQVFTTADVGESVALYQALPLFPHPERYQARAAEGLRTNITSAFNAIALRNPYPAEYFDEATWNQMVLKALFVGSPLHLIYGLDRRSNEKLAHMLVDYAHERWAASRRVAPELWRPVGPFVDEAIAEDLERVLAEDDPVQQEAAALALSQSETRRAQQALAARPELARRIADGELTWTALARNRPEDGA